MTERSEILHENLAKFFAEQPLSGSVLVVDDAVPSLPEAGEISQWHTRYRADHEAALAPPEKNFDSILIRLPKSHAYFDFVLTMTLPYLSSDGALLVYGLNDEGIKGAQKKLAEMFDDVEPAQIKNHGRILRCIQPKSAAEPKDATSFAQKHILTHASTDYEMVYFPGMFASGELDDGTQLLLDSALPLLTRTKRALDYACGSGIIARVLRAQYPDMILDLLDNDVLSLHAAQVNYTSKHGGDLILGDSLAQIPSDVKYDQIISNPPIHTEKQEQLTTVENLISNAPRHLTAQGQLIIVVQARIPLDDQFEKAFSDYRVIAETTRFKVWLGTV